MGAKSRGGFPFYDMLPVILVGLAFPLALFMWLGNFAINKIFTSAVDFDDRVIPPGRWLFSILAPILFLLYAIKRKGVNKSGALLGIIFAFIISIANHAFFACLVTFFITSSRATKFRAEEKRRFESDFKGGEGERNWKQVLCNIGMSTQLALLYLLDCGSSERVIDFSQEYRASWLGIAFLSSIASSNGDTWASELATVLSSSSPFLITTRRTVPRGTNGGVTVVGLALSFAGGLAIGLAYYLTISNTVHPTQFVTSPPQWPLIFIGGLAGFFGSMVDSVIGATFQYSGIDKNGKIVEWPGKDIKHISGFRLLDNHSVNLISSIAAGVFMPAVAIRFWPES